MDIRWTRALCTFLGSLFYICASDAKSASTSFQATYVVSDSKRALEVVRNSSGTVVDCIAYGHGKPLLQAAVSQRWSTKLVEPRAFSEEVRRCQQVLRVSGVTTDTVMEGRRRRRRSLLQGIYPNTKWCGFNDIADHSSDLSAHLPVTDKCCRDHDLQTSCCLGFTAGYNCPIHHVPMTRKFGRISWDLYTKSPCDCDEEFRRCLEDNISRGIEADESRNVGDLFFNTLAPKCLYVHSHEERVCTKWRFWPFWCRRYGTRTTETVEERSTTVRF